MTLKPRRAAVGLCLCLLFLLGSSIYFPSLVEVRAQSTGLVPDQWARYSVNGDFSEGVITSNFTVVSLASNTLTVYWVDTYSDGSNIPETISLDLITGLGNTHGGFYFAIYPGKNVGAPVYQNSRILENVTISQRMTQTYAQASRLVNYATDTNSTRPCPASCTFDTVSYYWDVDTGVFTRIIHTYTNSTYPQQRVGVDAIMTGTNIWAATPSGSNNDNSTALYFTAITLASILILFVILTIGHLRKKPRAK